MVYFSTVQSIRTTNTHSTPNFQTLKLFLIALIIPLGMHWIVIHFLRRNIIFTLNFVKNNSLKITLSSLWQIDIEKPWRITIPCIYTGMKQLNKRIKMWNTGNWIKYWHCAYNWTAIEKSKTQLSPENPANVAVLWICCFRKVFWNSPSHSHNICLHQFQNCGGSQHIYSFSLFFCSRHFQTFEHYYFISLLYDRIMYRCFFSLVNSTSKLEPFFINTILLINTIYGICYTQPPMHMPYIEIVQICILKKSDKKGKMFRSNWDPLSIGYVADCFHVQYGFVTWLKLHWNNSASTKKLLGVLVFTKCLRTPTNQLPTTIITTAIEFCWILLFFFV